MPKTTSLKRLGLDAGDFERRPVNCPAGVRTSVEGIPAVRCGIEDSKIDAAHDPSTLLHHCMGDYMGCPTWRAEKQHVWAVRDRMNPRRIIDGG